LKAGKEPKYNYDLGSKTSKLILKLFIFSFGFIAFGYVA